MPLPALPRRRLFGLGGSTIAGFRTGNPRVAKHTQAEMKLPELCWCSDEKCFCKESHEGNLTLTNIVAGLSWTSPSFSLAWRRQPLSAFQHALERYRPTAPEGSNIRLKSWQGESGQCMTVAEAVLLWRGSYGR